MAAGRGTAGTLAWPGNAMRVAGCETVLMIFDGYVHQLPDTDPGETQEWLDSLDAVIDVHGKTRARYLLSTLLDRAREAQVSFPATVSTPYINTIPRESEPWFPGDEFIERRIRAFVRWNAAMMVVKANKAADGIGGHLSTYASSASLYEIGFNHFFRGKDDGKAGDQSTSRATPRPGSTPGRSSRGGSSPTTSTTSAARSDARPRPVELPAPRLMPDFWEFPTVSMGLGPITALYQARYNRYLLNRQLADTSQSRVWAFLGDGECDEPETLGALARQPRAPRQPRSSSSTATCNASTDRCAATARSSRSSRRCSAAPAGTSSR